MRGLYPLRQTPHPSAMLRIASTLSHKARGKKADLSLDFSSLLILLRDLLNLKDSTAIRSLVAPRQT